jgi:hypothetical protein
MEAQAQQQHEWRHVRLQTELWYCLGSLAQWTGGCSSHLEAFGEIALLPILFIYMGWWCFGRCEEIF